MDWQGYLAVSDLVNHRYCARITWFAYVLGIPQRGTIKTEAGRERHQRWTDREQRRWREGKRISAQRKLMSLDITSETLGLRGRLDAAIDEAGGIVPYEIKATTAPPTPWPGQRLQLAAYALLIEDSQVGGDVEKRPVNHGYLHYLDGDELAEQTITETDKQSVVGTIEAIRSVITSEVMPARAPASHCRDCVFRKICV